MDTKQLNDWAPERIYLQREQGEGGSHTWCEDSVGDGDIIEEAKYVRADVAALAPSDAAGATLSNEDMRNEWRAAGGSIHGPRVETVTMPEEDYFKLRRSLYAAPVAPAPLTDVQIYEISDRVFTTRVDDSEILEFVRAILAAPVAPAAASPSEDRAEQKPIATIRRDGSMFHTQWHREMPELFKLDVYAEPITEPEHSALYISQKLTGSTKDAAFIQAHINQAVSEALAAPTPTVAADAAAPSDVKREQERQRADLDDCILDGIRRLSATHSNAEIREFFGANARAEAQPDERAALRTEIDRLRNDLAAAKQDAATAWERHAMANRISAHLQDERAAAPQADESELAKKDRTIAFLRDQNQRIIETADRLGNDATRNAEDAARYQWLRRQAVASHSGDDLICRWEVDYVLRGESFDSAVDAARAGGSNGKA